MRNGSLQNQQKGYTGLKVCLKVRHKYKKAQKLVPVNLPRGPAVQHRGLYPIPVMIYVGKESERAWMCVHVELNHFAVQQKRSLPCKSTLSQ